MTEEEQRKRILGNVGISEEPSETPAKAAPVFTNPNPTPPPSSPADDAHRQRILGGVGIAPDYSPTEIRSAQTPVTSEIGPMAQGYWSGLKSIIDVPAEKLASVFGQGESVRAADQKARQNFLDLYGSDPYATAADVAGKGTGIVIGSLATRRFATPFMENTMISSIPYASTVAPAALEGYVGSKLAGGDTGVGTAIGAMTPGLNYLARTGVLANKLAAVVAPVAASVGWRYGLSPMEALMSGFGAGGIAHYVGEPIQWGIKQLTRSPALTAGLASNVLPNPLLMPSNDPVVAGAQATP